MMDLLTNLPYGPIIGGGLVPFDLPAGFDGFSFPEVSFFRRGVRSYTATVDEAALTPTTNGIVYVDAATGSDFNDGKQATPVASLDRAIAAAATPGFLDQFNRANETLQSGEWDVVVGSASVASNQAAGGSESLSIFRFDRNIASANQFAEATVVSGTGNVGLMVRASGSQGYVLTARPNATNTYRLWRYNAGLTLLAAVDATAPTFPATIRLEIEGSVLRGYLGGVEVISHTLATDDFASHQQSGLYFSLSNVFDDFRCGQLGDAAITAPRLLVAPGTYSLTATVPSNFTIERSGVGTVTIGTGNVVTASGANMMLDGLRFNVLLDTTGGTRLIKNCTFSNASGEGVHLHGSGKACLIDCVVDGVNDDGIDWADSVDGVEIRTNVISAGSLAASNASTAHNTSRVVRVDSVYSNAARVIHDVQTSKSVNLGCVVRDSTGAAGEFTSFLVGAGFSTIASETVEVWLYGCDMSEGGATVDLQTDSEGTIYVDSETLYSTSATGSQIELI